MLLFPTRTDKPFMEMGYMKATNFSPTNLISLTEQLFDTI